MQPVTRLGAIGAMLMGVLFALFAVDYLVLLPSVGLVGEAYRDPAKVYPVVAVVQIEYLLGIAFAFAGILLLVGLYNHLHPHAPVMMSVAGVIGICSIVLSLAEGMLGYVIVSRFASTYAVDPVAGAALLAIRIVVRGLDAATTFATGWFFIVVSWAARSTQRLPAALCYLGILIGGLLVLDLVVPGDVAGLSGGALASVWAVWLGLVLWRWPTSTSSTQIKSMK